MINSCIDLLCNFTIYPKGVFGHTFGFNGSSHHCFSAIEENNEEAGRKNIGSFYGRIKNQLVNMPVCNDLVLFKSLIIQQIFNEEGLIND